MGMARIPPWMGAASQGRTLRNCAQDAARGPVDDHPPRCCGARCPPFPSARGRQDAASAASQDNTPWAPVREVSIAMRCLLLCLLLPLLAAAEPWGGAVSAVPATHVDLVLPLADGTSATVRVYHPQASAAPCPVVIFSHGLAGSKEGYGFLGERWSRHGYVAIHPDHPGSDTAAFRGKRLAEIGPALKAATQDVAILAGRPALIRALIDALPQIQAKLPGLVLDRERIGVAAHSFGAWTTK